MSTEPEAIVRWEGPRKILDNYLRYERRLIELASRPCFAHLLGEDEQECGCPSCSAFHTLKDANAVFTNWRGEVIPT